MKRVIAEVGDLLDDLVALGTVCGKDMSELSEIAHRCAENGDCLRISELALGGEDLKNMGLGGAEIGEMLEKLLDAALADPSINTKDSLSALVRELSRGD